MFAGILSAIVTAILASNSSNLINLSSADTLNNYKLISDKTNPNGAKIYQSDYGNFSTYEYEHGDEVITQPPNSVPEVPILPEEPNDITEDETITEKDSNENPDMNTDSKTSVDSNHGNHVQDDQVYLTKDSNMESRTSTNMKNKSKNNDFSYAKLPSTGENNNEKSSISLFFLNISAMLGLTLLTKK
ncbi:MAG: hypothetical protein LBC17_00135 [Lactobacillaceae bacterium]|jgi:hypothetical protein|nr:hypothetical protein [Lactobacillaceae bacterium]